MLWNDRAWVADVLAWVGEAVTATGPAEQTRRYPWATVLRVPTSEGPVWFKANAPGLEHEAALVVLLSSRRPKLVPELLAVDRERGWMLTADAGEPLRQVVAAERSLDRWIDVLPAYADLQLALAQDADELLALGVPDLRLATLPARYEQLVDDLGGDDALRYRAAVPLVHELSAELGEYGIAETIQHDDLHDQQVFAADGGHRILDWGDAVVSHPFFTLSVTLEGVIQWGLEDIEGSVDTAPFRDAYLRPFESGRSLTRAVEIALRLGWASRAVATHAAAHEPPERIHTRLRMFLDGRA